MTDHNFSDEPELRTLTVQRLGRSRTSWPCKAKGDSCPLPGDWIVISSDTGLASLACHEHIADLLWSLWPPPG